MCERRVHSPVVPAHAAHAVLLFSQVLCHARPISEIGQGCQKPGVQYRRRRAERISSSSLKTTQNPPQISHPTQQTEEARRRATHKILRDVTSRGKRCHKEPVQSLSLVRASAYSHDFGRARAGTQVYHNCDRSLEQPKRHQPAVASVKKDMEKKFRKKQQKSWRNQKNESTDFFLPNVHCVYQDLVNHLPKPRAATSVATKIGALPERNSFKTQSRSGCALSP